MKKKRTYTPEFKQRALELAESIGSANKAAMQLGISGSTIHEWKKGLASPSKTVADCSSLKQENERLKRENAELKKVNYILKGAAAFFSQDHLKKSSL